MMVCVPLEMEADKSRVQSHPQLQSVFKASWTVKGPVSRARILSLKIPHTLLARYKGTQQELIWKLPPCIYDAGRCYTG